MRAMRWLLVLGLLSAGALIGAENQAYFAILVETSLQRNAGMPDMSVHLKNMDPEMLKQLPPNVRAMMAGGPQRQVRIRLWSPTIAPADATAQVAPPAGLKQGPRLDLELYRPKSAAGGGGGDDLPGGPGGQMPKFTIKRYWGSSPTVKPGQPEVVKFDGLSAPEQTAMRREAAKARAGSEYFYKEGWTTGYWPTGKQPGQIAPDASLVGTFALTTNYTGETSLEVPPGVDFLAPIQLTKPDLAKLPDLTRPLAFEWQAIPHALGLHARLMGMIGQETLILWTSSEIREDLALNYDFLQMAEVRQFVSTTQMMAGDRTSVTVPAAIFQDCDMVMMQMIGYGPGVARNEGQPIPRLQTKTTYHGMMGGKQARGVPVQTPGGNEDD